MKLYTRKEAARALKVGLRTLDRRLATGELECFRLGDGPRAPVRIAGEHIAEYLRRCSGETRESARERARRIAGQ